MALMKAIMDRLPTLRNSQDFSTIIPELQDRLRTAEAEAGALNAELEDALFASPDKRDQAKKKIAANLAEQEELKIAIAGAERRQKEAAAAETSAEVEKRMIEAKSTQKSLLESYLKLGELFEAASKEIAVVQRLEVELRSANDLARLHKRKDLVVRSPWQIVGDFIGHPNYGPQHPYTGVEIAGYFPLRHPDGPALSRMKEVKL